MNKRLERALAKPEILIMGPVVSPASGDKVPVHYNLRKIFSYPNSLKIIAEEIGKILKKLKVDKIAGGETAGIPLVTATSLVTRIPMVYVRKEKVKPPRSPVEGIIHKGERVALLDDSFVSGEHKEIFIKNIEQVGGRVVALIVLAHAPNTSKEEQRRKYLLRLKRKGIKFFNLWQHPEMFKVMEKYGHLSPEMAKIAIDAASDMRKWQNNPQKWTWFYKIKKKQKGKFI